MLVAVEVWRKGGVVVIEGGLTAGREAMMVNRDEGLDNMRTCNERDGVVV